MIQYDDGDDDWYPDIPYDPPPTVDWATIAVLARVFSRPGRTLRLWVKTGAVRSRQSPSGLEVDVLDVTREHYARQHRKGRCTAPKCGAQPGFICVNHRRVVS